MFLSKEERAALALKRRAEQVEAENKSRESRSTVLGKFTQLENPGDRERRRMGDIVSIGHVKHWRILFGCGVTSIGKRRVVQAEGRREGQGQGNGCHSSECVKGDTCTNWD